MNSGEHPSTMTSQDRGCPTLREWNLGAPVAGLSSDDIGVWLVDLDAGLASQAEVDGAEPGPELAVLDEVEQARAARFVRARDRRRFARCRAALREILGGLLVKEPASITFRSVARGKPELDEAELANGQPALRFNLSHSSNLAVIAVSHRHELGIDLEQVRPIGEAERIVASFFSEAEQAEFATIDDLARPMAFVRGWTRKEAILKGLGVGIAGLASRHESGFGSGALTAQFLPAVPRSCVDQWRLWEASPRAGFVATLACQIASVDTAAGCVRSAPSPAPDAGYVN
jgi:4'-phosphopantetheinyl transferase